MEITLTINRIQEQHPPPYTMVLVYQSGLGWSVACWKPSGSADKSRQWFLGWRQGPVLETKLYPITAWAWLPGYKEHPNSTYILSTEITLTVNRIQEQHPPPYTMVLVYQSGLGWSVACWKPWGDEIDGIQWFLGWRQGPALETKLYPITAWAWLPGYKEHPDVPQA